MGIIEIGGRLGFGMFLVVGGFRGGRLERVKRGRSMGIRCCFQFSGEIFMIMLYGGDDLFRSLRKKCECR